MSILIRSVLTGFLCLAVAGLSLASAKEITDGATPSENKIYIRTDGLACYFCAYGLERFFKKTGRIAAFDMNMKEGIVGVTLIQGRPLVSARDFRRYVHDAGFTLRWIRVELVGRLIRGEEKSVVFEVTGTSERLPVHNNEVVQQLPDKAFGEAVRIEARALEDENASFALELERYEAVAGESL